MRPLRSTLVHAGKHRAYESIYSSTYAPSILSTLLERLKETCNIPQADPGQGRG